MKRRSMAAAVALSLLLHGAVVWWARSQPPRDTKARSQAVEVQFTETRVTPPPPPVPPPPAPEPPPVAKREPPKAQVRPPRAAQVSTPTPPEVPPAPGSDVPTRESPKVALFTDLPRAGSLFELPSSLLQEPDAGVPEAPARKTPEQMVNEIAFSTLGRGRVERGLVHPYYSQLGKALLKQWDADRVVAQGGLKSYTEQFVQNSKLFNEIWLDRSAAYGKTGSPLDHVPPPKRSAPVNDRIQGIPGVDLEARKEFAREMRESMKATRRATIRVVQDLEGKLVSVELVDPSNDVKVDNEALADVRSAAAKLPVPPPEAVAGKTRISSLWSFELIISISPPIPTFTFEFDEALGTIDARLPLDRRIYKRVRLISVE